MGPDGLGGGRGAGVSQSSLQPVAVPRPASSLDRVSALQLTAVACSGSRGVGFVVIWWGCGTGLSRKEPVAQALGRPSGGPVAGRTR